MTAPEPPARPRQPALVPADEGPHEPSGDRWWHEVWSFDVWTADAVGVCTSLTVLPGLGRVWYWAAVVRPDEPLLHLVDLDVGGLRPGLELRTGGLWASHTCEAPFAQWTVANEAYAVALDDPAEALGRGLGIPSPVAFDLEWYAEGPPTRFDEPGPVEAYTQPATVDGVIELAGGPLELSRAAATRRHAWGVLAATAVAEGGGPLPAGAWVPFVVDGPDGPEVLDRVLTAQGWWERRRLR